MDADSLDGNLSQKLSHIRVLYVNGTSACTSITVQHIKQLYFRFKFKSDNYQLFV